MADKTPVVRLQWGSNGWVVEDVTETSLEGVIAILTFLVTKAPRFVASYGNIRFAMESPFPIAEKIRSVLIPVVEGWALWRANDSCRDDLIFTFEKGPQ
ncbi:MAG: hypothetical protein HY455_00895 [Parcubacteria group bacterium]|nr:hypothetical protein [Parcubacteria group bacterium]